MRKLVYYCSIVFSVAAYAYNPRWYVLLIGAVITVCSIIALLKIAFEPTNDVPLHWRKGQGCGGGEHSIPD